MPKDYEVTTDKPKATTKETKSEPSSEDVTIAKGEFQALMDRINRLEYAASKAATATYDNKRRKPFGKEATIRTYGDKIIVGWKTTADIVEKNPTTGVWFEDQRIQLAFEGEEKLSEEIPLQTYVRRYKNLPIKVLKETTDQETGAVTWSVETLEGETKKFDVNVQFVN